MNRSNRKCCLFGTPRSDRLEPGGKDTGNDGYSAERNRTAAGGAACHCPERKDRLFGGNADRCGLCQPACACIPDGGDPGKGRKITAPPPDGAAGARFGYWEGKSWQQVEAKYPDEFHLWREQPMVGIPSGGESRKSCEARSERAIRQILEETAGDAVIVAHGGILVF